MITIPNPIGLDARIQQLQVDFGATLFEGLNYESYGRAFLNTRDTIRVPEVYVGDGEYKEVLADDNLDALSFFLPDSSIPFEKNEGNAIVGIYFFVRLQTNVYRPVEEVHRDVLNRIQSSPFRVIRLVTGEESVDAFLDAVRVNMQPYYCFRFDAQVTFKLC